MEAVEGGCSTAAPQSESSIPGEGERTVGSVSPDVEQVTKENGNASVAALGGGEGQDAKAKWEALNPDQMAGRLSPHSEGHLQAMNLFFTAVAMMQTTNLTCWRCCLDDPYSEV